LAFALCADIGGLPFHAPVAAAFQADHIARDLQRHFLPVVEIFQSDLNLVLKVASPGALRSAAVPPAAAAAEQMAEEVIKPGTAAFTEAIGTVLIVATALFGVFEDIMGVVDLLEFVCGLGVIGMFVGMAFKGFLAKRSLQFSFVNLRRDTKNVVESGVDNHAKWHEKVTAVGHLRFRTTRERYLEFQSRKDAMKERDFSKQN
jgi:hypothetical protein